MTTRRPNHPAQASRVLAAGIATASMLGIGAAMAMAPPPASSSVVQASTPGATTVIVRRIVRSPDGQTVTRTATPSATGTVQQPRSTTRGS